MAKDTTENARKLVVQLYRQMSVCEKATRIFEAYNTGKMLAMAGLRQLHPDATKEQIWRLWAKQHLGETLFDKAYGDSADEQS